jgi:hypothetical protein
MRRSGDGKGPKVGGSGDQCPTACIYCLKRTAVPVPTLEPRNYLSNPWALFLWALAEGLWGTIAASSSQRTCIGNA